jgi:hypothetical protein
MTDKQALKQIAEHESTVSDSHMECMSCKDAYADDYFALKRIARDALTRQAKVSERRSNPVGPDPFKATAVAERVAVDMTFAGLADEIEKAEALGYTQMSLPTNTMRQIIKALSAINSAVVERMVNRFLAWKLPADFDPDGGISFKQVFGQTWPIGTNLFTAAQAKEMVRHMLDGIAVPTNSEAVSELVRADLERIVQMRPKNSNRVTTAHLMASRAEIALAKLGSRAPSPNLRQGDTP